MGNGIAHVFALSGYEVLLNDISDEGLKRAVATIDKNLERQVSRGKIGADEKAAALGRISTTLSLPDLGPLDLIIEAATERGVIVMNTPSGNMFWKNTGSLPFAPVKSGSVA